MRPRQHDRHGSIDVTESGDTTAQRESKISAAAKNMLELALQYLYNDPSMNISECNLSRNLILTLL